MASCVLIASIDLQHVDKSHDRRDDDLASSESQPSAFRVEPRCSFPLSVSLLMKTLQAKRLYMFRELAFSDAILRKSHTEVVYFFMCKPIASASFHSQ